MSTINLICLYKKNLICDIFLGNFMCDIKGYTLKKIQKKLFTLK